MSEQTLPPFKVGQIVYLIPTGERRVLPAQITEEILRRTVKGTETVWMIQIAGSPKNVPLDPDAAEYFTDMASLRDAMLERTRIRLSRCWRGSRQQPRRSSRNPFLKKRPRKWIPKLQP